MNLREQVRGIAGRRINLVFAEKVSFPLILTALAAQAFMEQWPESPDTRAVRKACELMKNPGWVSEDEGPVC